MSSEVAISNKVLESFSIVEKVPKAPSDLEEKAYHDISGVAFEIDEFVYPVIMVKPGFEVEIVGRLRGTVKLKSVVMESNGVKVAEMGEDEADPTPP